ncbi:emerin-like [Paralichthys olivaceus]|uniref:emerin-like n=1 Tax=Paralichthys olivaceus TaxID=8255 RepID=UPI003750D98D
MSSLSGKSAQEISELLDEFGIRHGPVVDSTRDLYEKKLREAMATEKRAKYSKPSPDKTYYREEEDEVTYVYRTPVKNEGGDYGDRGSYLSSRPNWAERELEQTSYSAYQRSRPESRGRDFVDDHYMHETPSTYRASSLKSTPMKSDQDAPKPPKSSPFIPMWVQLMFFLAVAIFLYLVFSSMETNESLKGLE